MTPTARLYPFEDDGAIPPPSIPEITPVRGNQPARKAAQELSALTDSALSALESSLVKRLLDADLPERDALMHEIADVEIEKGLRPRSST